MIAKAGSNAARVRLRRFLDRSSDRVVQGGQTLVNRRRVVEARPDAAVPAGAQSPDGRWGVASVNCDSAQVDFRVEIVGYAQTPSLGLLSDGALEPPLQASHGFDVSPQELMPAVTVEIPPREPDRNFTLRKFARINHAGNESELEESSETLFFADLSEGASLQTYRSKTGASVYSQSVCAVPKTRKDLSISSENRHSWLSFGIGGVRASERNWRLEGRLLDEFLQMI